MGDTSTEKSDVPAMSFDPEMSILITLIPGKSRGCGSFKTSAPSWMSQMDLFCVMQMATDTLESHIHGKHNLQIMDTLARVANVTQDTVEGLD